MSIIKKFLNLLRFAANFDRFVETVRVDNSGNVFIRFKRNVHINTAGHMMLTSRKGHIIVKGEHEDSVMYVCNIIVPFAQLTIH